LIDTTAVCDWPPRLLVATKNSILIAAPGAGIPMGLEQPLRQMVAPVAGARPPAAAFAGCQYFQADVLLRALKVSRLRSLRSCLWGWAGGRVGLSPEKGP
jgi:hypothetical protein